MLELLQNPARLFGGEDEEEEAAAEQISNPEHEVEEDEEGNGLAPSMELPFEEEEAKLDRKIQNSAERHITNPFEGGGSLVVGAFGGAATPGAV